MEMDRVKPGCSKRSKVNSESVEDKHEICCSKCHKASHNRRRCEENVRRIDESLHYFTFDFVFLFLPCIMLHVFIYFIMHHVSFTCIVLCLMYLLFLMF
jgi:hypothetical protein